ncbi:uncharacterized protein RAG0_01605 [Rhynchosporium agropyri]|uniref:Survival motor neuron Tudor domain-containing protein n=1 Tax=Rhynchosporium agropyri TaxID=914238 RepID=A0A1E1JXW8_9HELO|nr:uncharacterized protein RAG0_01605 [Rhynchosporium agropyri]
MASDSNASHAQIWDDSSLQNSWNDALGEYKKYHSIQARGEDTADIAESDESDNGQTGKNVHSKSDEDDPRAKRKATGGTADTDITSHEEKDPVERQREGSNGSPALPQHLIGQVHDEGLKNLLMSWYYAGYYTGLHEGKQIAAQGNKVAK